MKFLNYLTVVLFAFFLVITGFVHANDYYPEKPLQKCRTCSEDKSCSLVPNVKDWDVEECPKGDHNCNLVWEKSESGQTKLIYGGCTNNRISSCYKDTENNEICIFTCEGPLCNESIRYLSSYK